jgi:pimeloyl-ACP methyl ester carboxylesterase
VFPGWRITLMLKSVDPSAPSATTTMLLLPGFDGTGELFAPLISALGSHHDTLAVRYDDEIDLDDYVASVLATLPPEGASLIAESFSGPIALTLMARHPSRVRYAVLCATFATSPFRLLTRLARLAPPALFGPSPLQPLTLRRFGLDDDCDPELVDQAVSVIRSIRPQTIKSRLRLLAKIDLRPVLHRITTPILYLRASRDRIVSPRLSRELVSRLPRAQVESVDGPHLLLQSRPSECARLIKRFISATPKTVSPQPRTH